MWYNSIKSYLDDCAKSRRCVQDSTLVALVTAAFFCLILPTQSYLACADLFPYEYSSLFWALIWRCVLVGVSLFVLLSLSYFRCRGLIHILLLSLVLTGILESGPLAIGLPELNGDLSGYQSLTRKIVDSSVLVLALILPMAFAKYIRQYVGWISVALLFYSSVSLFDVQHAGKNEVQANFIVEKLYPREEVVKSVRFSPKRNVILLILDATSVDVIRDILNDDVVLRGKFTGFVNYVNNLGMEWTTSVAIPGMMTGKYFESAKDLPQYGQSVFTKDSVIYDYLQQGFPVYMNLGPYVEGYTNRPISDGDKEAPCESPLNQRMSGDFCFNAKQFSLFRIMPYSFKCPYMKSFAVAFAPKRDGDALNIHNDKELFSFLSARPVDLQEHCALNLHHAGGGHPPIVHDANGNRVDIENPTYTDYYAQCKYSLSNVAKMFDVWRTNGVYDASTIILLADHSTEFIKSGANYHGIPRPAFPFLMVKAVNSKGDYSEASDPTSHARIAPLLRALSKGNLSQQEVSKLLISKSRFCRQLGQGVLRDWTVTEDGKVVATVRDDIKSKRTINELVPLQIGKLYSFDIQNGKDYPDFVSDGFLPGQTGGLMAALSKEVMFSIRVNDASRQYDCHVFLEYGLKSSIDGRLICSCGFDIQVLQGSFTRKRYDILFKNIKPDQKGIINFYFMPAGAVPQFFLAKSIKCEYSQNFDDDPSCRSRTFKITCPGLQTENFAIPVKPWSLNMDMDVAGRAKVIFDGFLWSDSQMTKESEHIVDCNGRFDNGHSLSFRLFCGDRPTYFSKIMTVPDGATKLSITMKTDEVRKTMTTMHLGLKNTKDDGILVNDHPVELSSQKPLVKTLSLSGNASARRLCLYGITSENANVANDKAAILMVRYFDEIGNECFSDELPLSQQLKCGYIYLPVRPNEDLEFIKILNPPISAMKIELSVKRWYGASHVVLKELRYCFVEDEKLSADKTGR